MASSTLTIGSPVSAGPARILSRGDGGRRPGLWRRIPRGRGARQGDRGIYPKVPPARSERPAKFPPVNLLERSSIGGGPALSTGSLPARGQIDLDLQTLGGRFRNRITMPRE